MGPTSTLPPHHQPTTTSRNPRGRRSDPNAHRDLVVDVDWPRPADPHHDRASDQDQEAAVRRHGEPLDAHDAAHGGERPTAETEPAGRRLPVPLAGREGVER